MHLAIGDQRIQTCCRWFKAHGVVIPSEKRQRHLSEDILGDNLEAEEAPFTITLRHGGEDLRPAPLVFVPDLVTLVFQYLEQNQRYRYSHMYIHVHYLGNHK